MARIVGTRTQRPLRGMLRLMDGPPQHLPSLYWEERWGPDYLGVLDADS